MPEDIPGGDMSSCVTLMGDQGYDEDSAARICEALSEEASADHGNVAELQAAIERGRGLIADIGVELNSAVDQPAIDSKWVMFKSVDDAPEDFDTQMDMPFVFKQDGREEKRIAYAPAMIPRELDKEGDVVPTPTVENAAHDYMKQDGGVDSDHDLIDGKGEVVESWIEPDERTWDLPGGGEETYSAGTWMLGIEWDQETWKRIQEGELEGLSVYGKAEHIQLAKSATVSDHIDGLADFADVARKQIVNALSDIGVESGTTPKSDAEESDKQERTMSDDTSDDDNSALADRVDEIEASVSDVNETVTEIKDTLESEADAESEAKDDDESKQDEGDLIRQFAADYAQRDDVGLSAADVQEKLREVLSQEDDDEDDEDDDDEEEASADSKDVDKRDDSDANFKGSDGTQTASKGLGDEGSKSELSYRALAEGESE